MRLSSWLALVLFINLSACSILGKKSHEHQTGEEKNESVNVVINSLKDELKLFSDTLPSSSSGGISQQCGDAAGKAYINIRPINATLQLKILSTDSGGIKAEAKIPLGPSGLTLDPSVAANISRLNSQLITIDLDIDHQKTKEELRTNIAKLSQEIETNKKYAQEIAKKQRKDYIEKVNKINQTKKNELLENYLKLIDAEGIQPETPSKDLYSDEKFKDKKVAEALYKIRESLLAVDHQKLPCLKPRQIRTEIAFQVTKKVDGSPGVSFFIVSVGGELIHSDDRTHTLIVVFDLADSSSLLVL